MAVQAVGLANISRERCCRCRVSRKRCSTSCETTVYQRGDGNDASHRVQGWDNASSITMDGQGNFIELEQAGSQNTALVTFLGSWNNSQQSRLVDAQPLLSSALLLPPGKVVQVGADHALTLSAIGSSNAFALYQSGSTNSINATIMGSGNALALAQTGVNDAVKSHQAGNGNALTVHQF